MSKVRVAVVAKAISENAGNAGSKWVLTLACGHRAVRHRRAGMGNGNWRTHEAPKYVYCKGCQKRDTDGSSS